MLPSVKIIKTGPGGGGGGGGGPPPAWAPANISGLKAFWHADDVIYAATTPGAQQNFAPKLPDNSGNGHTVQAGANSTSPLYNATAVGGAGGLEFGAGAQNGYYATAAGVGGAAAWTHLHDGSGGTVIALLKPNSTAADCTIADTMGSTTSRGIHFFHDGTNDRFGIKIWNAAGQIALVTGGVAPEGSVYTAGFTYAEGDTPGEVQLYVNGVRVASGDTTGAPSALAPQFHGFSIGRLGAAGLNYLNGFVRVLLVYNRVLTPTEIAEIHANLSTLATPRTLRRIWTVGDSITACTYQPTLNDRIVASASVRADFLGSLLAGEAALYTDRQHNGHIAHTIQSITTQIDNVALDFVPTDVLVIAGTNNAGNDPATTQAAYTAMVDMIQAQRPGARVWIGRPPRRIAPATNIVWTEDWATWLQGFAAARGLTYVNTDVQNDSGMSVDGIHPNNTSAGYPYMGNQWANALGL